MNTSRRQKKVASLLHQTLSRLLIEEFQDSASGLVTITRVELNPDLKVARIFVRFTGKIQNESLQILEKKAAFFRKAIASRVNLKYNPKLNFLVDPLPDYEEKLEQLFKKINGDEKKIR
ncbi:MAG: 30S ribosome-binding factor RbfA [Candidatus Aminicenantes bacterium]|nr:30S ribosome-binding factor RbfA [Candidatus Aminicenantes bacterium]